MTLSAIIKAMMDTGSTQEQILAVIKAHENALLEAEAVKREKTRLRVRKYRENNKPVTVTPVTSVTQKAPPYFPPSDGFPDPSFTTPLISPQKTSSKRAREVLPDWLPEQDWKDFVEMRRKKGVFTAKAAELILKDLEKLRGDGHDPGLVLQQSVKNGWKGVFKIKEENQSRNYGKPTITDAVNDIHAAIQRGEF